MSSVLYRLLLFSLCRMSWIPGLVKGLPVMDLYPLAFNSSTTLTYVRLGIGDNFSRFAVIMKNYRKTSHSVYDLKYHFI